MEAQKKKEEAKPQEQQNKEMMDNFKKAFSVCLEAKKYMVKY